MPTNHIDLHTHTTASDGTHSPAEQMELAVKAGLTHIAITDHDTTSGIHEAAAAAESLPVTLIPGIEVSTSIHDTEVHMVGLYVDPDDEMLDETLRPYRVGRQQKNERTAAALRSLGFPVTVDAVREEQGNGTLNRANFARWLVAHGHVPSVKEAFKRYLNPGRPAYVFRTYPDPADVISAIHHASGLAILAHPLLYGFTHDQVRDYAKELRDMGMDGIEVYYARSMGEVPFVSDIAKELDLVPSGGSDFHGHEVKPDIDLGSGLGDLYIPEEVLTEQRDRLQELRA